MHGIKLKLKIGIATDISVAIVYYVPGHEFFLIPVLSHAHTIE